MLRDLTLRISDTKMKWKPKPLKHMDIAQDLEVIPQLALITLGPQDGMPSMPVPRGASIVSLGTLLSRDGSTFAAADHRIQIADHLFDEHVPLYLPSKASHALTRWQTFNTIIVTSAIVGCGRWIWSQAVFRKLRKRHNYKLRIIWGLRIRPDELLADYRKRTAK